MTKNTASPRKELLLCINIKITFKNFSISCPHYSSHSFYRYRKEKYGGQKYIYPKCCHQFTLKPNKIKISNKDYSECLICGRNAFAWHK